MQSLKKLFASNTAEQAGGSSSKATLYAEDEDIEMDPEYAPKRALTTKVHHLERNPLAINSEATAKIVRVKLVNTTHFGMPSMLAYLNKYAHMAMLLSK